MPEAHTARDLAGIILLLYPESYIHTAVRVRNVYCVTIYSGVLLLLIIYNNDLRTNRLEMGTTEEQTASDYFDQKTKLARLAGGRREHCRGRPQQSRGRRARRGKTSKQHTEWWASSQATQLAYVTFYRIPIKLPASQRSALTGR